MIELAKRNMVFGLGILTILTFGVMVVPTRASADRAGYVTPYNSTRFVNVGGNERYNYITDSSTTDYFGTPIVYSGSAITPKTTTIVKRTASKSGSVLGASTIKSKDSVSNIAANAVYGSSNFMPSGIIQWILFAILILVIVILVRKIFSGEKDYHSTPMKHA